MTMIHYFVILLLPLSISSENVEQTTEQSTTNSIEQVTFEGNATQEFDSTFRSVHIRNSTTLICSGVLLDLKVVITTASCVHNYNSAQLSVFPGYHKEEQERKRNHAVARYLIHEGFNAENLDNNVALLLLNSSIHSVLLVEPFTNYKQHIRNGELMKLSAPLKTWSNSSYVDVHHFMHSFRQPSSCVKLYPSLNTSNEDNVCGKGQGGLCPWVRGNPLWCRNGQSEIYDHLCGLVSVSDESCNSSYMVISTNFHPWVFKTYIALLRNTNKNLENNNTGLSSTTQNLESNITLLLLNINKNLENNNMELFITNQNLESNITLLLNTNKNLENNIKLSNASQNLESKNKGLITGMVSVTSLLTFFTFLGLSYKLISWRRKSKSVKDEEESLPMTLVETNKSDNPNPTIFNEKDCKLRKEELLGSGKFSVVYKGKVTISGKEVEAAFKTMKECKEIDDVQNFMMSEIEIMSRIGSHSYIIDFFGIFNNQIDGDEKYIVLEYCGNGDLWKYLQNSYFEGKKKGDKTHCLTKDLLLDWCYQIANGLQYIGTKNIVHRDLAARNILLSTDLTIRICDFGIARPLEKYSMNFDEEIIPSPYRWSAYEFLRKLSYSVHSDVWTFGVLAWEIYELGKIPFAEFNSPPELARALENNYRLSKPQYLPDELWKWILKCWRLNPIWRPILPQLQEIIQNIKVGKNVEECNGNILSNESNYMKASFLKS